MKLWIILAGLCLTVMCVYIGSVDAKSVSKDKDKSDKGCGTGKEKSEKKSVSKGKSTDEDEEPTDCDNNGGPKNQKLGEKCKPRLCEACEDDKAVCIFECNKYEDGEAEEQYACNCKPGYEETCGVCEPNEGNHGDLCSADDDHCTGRLECVNGKCACPTGFYYLATHKECYGRYIGDPCSTNYDTCDKGSHLKCVGGSCACDDLHGYEYDSEYDMCLSGYLGEECRTTCDDSHATCTNNRCSCNTGYVAVNGACVGSTNNDVCNPAVDTCSNAQNLACGSSGKCECNPPNFIWNVTRNMCVGTEIGDVCDYCSDPNASCLDVCVCKSPYKNRNGRCEIVKPPGAHYGEQCQMHPDNCVDDNNVCMDEICVCNDYSTYDQILQKCVILLGAPCKSHSDTCADSHATCQNAGCGERCDCTNGYVNSHQEICNGTCLQTRGLGEDCDDSTICVPTDSVECSNGTCACREGFEPAGDDADYCNKTIYVKELGDYCSCDDVCKPRGKAFCNTSDPNPTCECKPEYVEENDTCKSGLNGTCHDSTDCAYYPMLRCYTIQHHKPGKQRRCECNFQGVNGVVYNEDGTECICKNPDNLSCHRYTYENNRNNRGA